ncbi:MAG: hypothetical protein ACXAEX_01705 [Promethearchaeota archaeon]
MGDPNPEVIGCSFSAEMKAFDLKGNEKFLIEYPSNNTCLKIASVNKENNIELISGNLDGLINIVDTKANAVWSKKLNSAVICMDTGDIKDDTRSEILVGLDEQKLVGLDNNGEIFLEFKTDDYILDCAIGYFSDDYAGKCFVLLKSGEIFNVTNEGKPELVVKLEEQPTSLTLCNYNEQPVMLVGYKNGSLKIFNSHQEIIGEYELKEKVSRLDSFVISSEQKKESFIAAASKNILTLFKLEKSMRKELLEVTAEQQPQDLTTDEISETTPTPTEPKVKSQDVRVLRGGQIEGGEYLFKIKVINDRKFNITDVNVHILSYPEESLKLSQIDAKPQSSPDRVKFHKISKGGGFVSPSFVFRPKKDCIKGTIHAVVNFINEEDQIETFNVKPHEIRMICGLLQPKSISNEEFESLTKDLLTFKAVGEEFTVPYKAEKLYQKLMVLLKNKNFEVINAEKEESEGKFLASIKGFAEGTFSKNSVGLKLTLTGKQDEQESILKVEIFAEDIDMSPSIISEFEDAVNPQSCPECEESLPLELLKRVLNGIPVYCEACGSKLLEESGNLKAEKE